VVVVVCGLLLIIVIVVVIVIVIRRFCQFCLLAPTVLLGYYYFHSPGSTGPGVKNKEKD